MFAYYAENEDLAMALGHPVVLNKLLPLSRAMSRLSALGMEHVKPLGFQSGL